MNQVDLASHAARPKPLGECLGLLGGCACLQFTGGGISCRQA
jgi:hypothetical protein